MTREEAINQLYGMRADNLNLDDLYTGEKYDALGIAIKALKNENALIDRVLEIIDDEMEQLPSKALRLRPLLYQGSPDLNGELWACLDIKERVMALKGGDK